jgi:glyoxylate utilization-related uncharacterized protein
MFSEVAVPRPTARKAATIEPRIQTAVNKIIAIKNKPSSKSTVLSSIRNLIEKGTVHVHLGEQERDLHAGGTVFIPANTWVDIKNAGTERVSVVFVFSAPGFENYMRCDSVLPNEKVTPLSLEGQKECSHQGHVTYKDLDESPKN